MPPQHAQRCEIEDGCGPRAIEKRVAKCLAPHNLALVVDAECKVRVSGNLQAGQRSDGAVLKNACSAVRASRTCRSGDLTAAIDRVGATIVRAVISPEDA